ncbi:MAG TPA: class I SAM-dependent methyltransferase [Nitrospira sp.]|nr:class I SAM-dependent methyltransferase [Nitrospira sp.]
MKTALMNPKAHSRDVHAPAKVPFVPLAPHPPLHRYYGEGETRQRFLNNLFNRTAYQYRNIDKATGLGFGIWYRRRALQYAGLTAGMHVLDVACGPALVAECAREIVGLAGSVVGLDPSLGMLREARKGPCGKLVIGVGERLPFPDAAFDFLSMGYALRHVSDLRAAFAEYRRVLKPGGVVLLLEISRPRSPLLLSVSRFYIKTVLGIAFSASTGNRDMKTLMEYWWDTTESCVHPDAIVSALQEAGFSDCSEQESFNGLLRDYRAVRASTVQ